MAGLSIMTAFYGSHSNMCCMLELFNCLPSMLCLILQTERQTQQKKNMAQWHTLKPMLTLIVVVALVPVIVVVATDVVATVFVVAAAGSRNHCKGITTTFHSVCCLCT